MLVLLPVFINDSIIFPYSINKFDIAKLYPKLWFNLKLIYIITFFISSLFIFDFIFNKFINEKINNFKLFKLINNKLVNKFKRNKHKNNNIIVNNKNNFSLYLGNFDKTNEKAFIPLKGLFQNILVTGTIGSRKNQQCNVSFL